MDILCCMPCKPHIILLLALDELDKESDVEFAPRHLADTENGEKYNYMDLLNLHHENNARNRANKSDSEQRSGGEGQLVWYFSNLFCRLGVETSPHQGEER
jgi:hypothetical protein